MAEHRDGEVAMMSRGATAEILMGRRDSDSAMTRHR